MSQLKHCHMSDGCCVLLESAVVAAEQGMECIVHCKEGNSIGRSYTAVSAAFPFMQVMLCMRLQLSVNAAPPLSVCVERGNGEKLLAQGACAKQFPCSPLYTANPGWPTPSSAF